MDNLVLIGMPSSGKSTAGRRLAARLQFDFCDSDALIKKAAKKPLAQIIEERGNEGFLALESEVNRSLTCTHTVISTGGSVCYLPEAMAHLKETGTIVYLQLSAEEVGRRIVSFQKRGVVMRGNVTTAEELAREREPLYEKYADITVNCDGQSVSETVEEILLQLTKQERL